MSIVLFIGRNGYGKSAAAVEYGVLPCWAAGRPVVSNITLYPEELGVPAELYVPLGDGEETLPRIGRHMKRMCIVCCRRARFDTCRHCGLQTVIEVPKMHPAGGLWSLTGNVGCGLLIDEVTTEFPSRGTLNVPPALQAITKQFRKPDVAPVLLTDTSYARVDLLLREVLMKVVESEPFSPLGIFTTKPTTPFGWPEYRAFKRFSYDGQAYERADRTGRWNDCQPSRPRYTWRKPKIARVFAAYSSRDGVDLADRIACKECGGDFRRSPCKEPLKHRETTRRLHDEREHAAYPITPDLLERAGFVDEAAALDRGELEGVSS